jgi:hypothetical protein
MVRRVEVKYIEEDILATKEVGGAIRESRDMG